MLIIAKTLVIGIDGVELPRINRLIEKERLYNLKKLRDEGFLTELKSTVPQVSAPAWVSFSTGLRPENHGIYGFFKTNKDIYNGEDIDKDRFWEKFENKVVMNIPLTYPPLSEIMVSGLVSPVMVKPSKEEYYEMCSPSEIGEILELNDYILTAGEEIDYKGYVEIVKRRRDVFLDILDKNVWDLGVVMFGAYDRLTHNPITNADSKELDEILVEIDGCIGDILDEVGNVNLVVMSDHGSKEVRNEFYISQLLVDNDLAEFVETDDGIELSTDSDALFYAEEHSEYGKIKVNNKERKGEVKKILESAEGIEKVMESEEVYGKEAIGDVPEIIFKVKNGVPKKGPGNPIFKKNKSIQHSMYGIFGMCGPDVPIHLNPRDVKIEDVGPTILDMAGKPCDSYDGSSVLEG